MTDKVKNEEEKYLVPGLVRGIDILRLFSRERTTLSAPDMAGDLDIPRSTVFRLVQTLEYLGLLEQTGSGKEYRLAMGVLGLGFEYLASLELTELARPVMERLSADTGHYSHLVVRDGAEVVVLVRAAGSSAFASSLHVGTRLPAHGTVLGRVMLADLDDGEINAVYPDGKMPQFSKQTPGALNDLKLLLNQDRERGYALSDGYFESGISAVAASVRGADGKVCAAINVTVPGVLTEGQGLRDLIAVVTNAASELSRLLNYRGVAVQPAAVDKAS